MPCQRLQGQPSVAETPQGRHQATHTTSLQTTHICAAVVKTVHAHLPTSHELPYISQPPLSGHLTNSGQWTMSTRDVLSCGSSSERQCVSSVPLFLDYSDLGQIEGAWIPESLAGGNYYHLSLDFM